MITITPTGRYTTQVRAEDIARACDAAEAALAQRGVTPEEAFASYEAQWLVLDDEDLMTGSALAWVAARHAADMALTATWYDPDAEVFCEMAA